MSSTPDPLAAAPAKPKFGRVFWTLNTIEMWERLAYYNLRVMAPIYIMQADNPGSLHLTAMDKGVISSFTHLLLASAGSIPLPTPRRMPPEINRPP